MSNPHRGEIAFTAAGQAYTLRYSINALCELETALGRGVVDIAQEMQSWAAPAGPDGKPLPETPEQARDRTLRIRMSVVRAVFWAGLRDRHPDVTLSAAGDLLSAAGGLTGGLALISDAFAAAFPDPVAMGAGESPPVGQAGTGRPS